MFNGLYTSSSDIETLSACRMHCQQNADSRGQGAPPNTVFLLVWICNHPNKNMSDSTVSTTLRPMGEAEAHNQRSLVTSAQNPGIAFVFAF